MRVPKYISEVKKKLKKMTKDQQKSYLRGALQVKGKEEHTKWLEKLR